MKKGLSFLIFMACAMYLIAQTTFTATVSRNQVNTSDRFTINFTLTNGSNHSGFTPPSFSDFYILGGPNQSTSFQSINGKTTQSISFGYVLQPKAAGKFTIGAATIKSGKDTYTTTPITIEVSERAVSNNTDTKNDETTDVRSYLNKNLFIRATVDKQSVYKGEEIIVTYLLYVNRNSLIYDYRVTSATLVPKFNGFYASDIDVSQSSSYYENIDGQSHLVQVLKKTKLTPQSSGQLLVDPLGVEAVVAVRANKKKQSDDFWDEFFSNPFNSSYEKFNQTITSNSLKVEVKDLPANPPLSFNGAVGKFNLQTEINTTETKTDEPITYRLKINGTGNLQLFQTPVLDLPPGWETYEPKITESSTSKTYEYLLIPRSPGDFTIPAHNWSFFDPDKKQYQTLTAQAYDIHVEAGSGYSGGNATGITKEEVELLAQDIRYIKTKTPVFAPINNLLHSPVAYIGLSLPVLLGIFLFFYTAKRNALEKDIAGMRNRRATAVAKKRLKLANNYLTQNNTKAFYDETIKAVWGYLSDKFNIPQSNLSKEVIAS
ncbi:MAG: BatD family protein, partial [Chitinophagales bacterium]